MSVSKLESGRYRVRWREPGGTQRAKHFSLKRDADQFDKEVHSQMNRSAYVRPSDGRMLFREYANEWQQAQVHRLSTANQVARHLRKHVNPVIGDRPLSDIRSSEVQKLVRGLSTSLAPNTIEVVYRYVSSIFSSAVRDRRISFSPCVGIKLPKKNPKEFFLPTTEQVEALIKNVPVEHRAAILVAASAGLRPSEVTGLTLDRVNFLGLTIRVDRQLISRDCDDPFGPPKSSASIRTVPVSGSLVEELSFHVSEGHHGGAQGLLFVAKDGRPLTQNRWGEIWRPAARQAGVPKGVGMHCLRHYYASLLIKNGESVTTVQHRLGHASARETLDTYAHLWPNSEQSTRAAVDSELGELMGRLRSARAC